MSWAFRGGYRQSSLRTAQKNRMLDALGFSSTALRGSCSAPRAAFGGCALHAHLRAGVLSPPNPQTLGFGGVREGMQGCGCCDSLHRRYGAVFLPHIPGAGSLDCGCPLQERRTAAPCSLPRKHRILRPGNGFCAAAHTQSYRWGSLYPELPLGKFVLTFQCFLHIIKETI